MGAQRGEEAWEPSERRSHAQVPTSVRWPSLAWQGAMSRTIYFLLSGEIDVYRGAGMPGATELAGPTSRLTPWHETDLSYVDWTGASPTTRFTARGAEVLLSKGSDSALTPKGMLMHEGIFGQAALLGRRREATLMARTSCEALLIAKEDMQTLFESDALSARRVCMLVLDDFLRMDRLSMLALRLRILSTRDSPRMRAALTIQYHWRRYNDLLARANDPTYELIEKGSQPSSAAVWASRSITRNRKKAVGKRHSAVDGGGAQTAVLGKLDEITSLIKNLSGRVEQLESATPRKSKKLPSGAKRQSSDAATTVPMTVTSGSSRSSPVSSGRGGGLE